MVRHKKFLDWLETRQGTIIKGLFALLLAYIMGSRAIHTGSFWQYGLAIVLLVWGVKRTYRGLRNKLA